MQGFFKSSFQNLFFSLRFKTHLKSNLTDFIGLFYLVAVLGLLGGDGRGRPQSKNLMLLHLSKKATISQEKAEIVLLSPRQGGRKPQIQNDIGTTTTTIQPFAPVFTSLCPGLHIKM